MLVRREVYAASHPKFLEIQGLSYKSPCFRDSGIKSGEKNDFFTS